MLLSDLIADLRLDLSDPGASLFEDQTLETVSYTHLTLPTKRIV